MFGHRSGANDSLACPRTGSGTGPTQEMVFDACENLVITAPGRLPLLHSWLQGVLLLGWRERERERQRRRGREEREREEE